MANRSSIHPGRRLGSVLVYLVLCAVWLPGLAACDGGARPGYTTRQQTVEGLTITLEQPQEVEILKDYEIFVTLTDAAGHPVDGASVFLDLTMPAMPMGANQPLAEPLGQGRYRVKGVFTMEGDWQVSVHANVAGKEYVARFDQRARLPQ